MRIAERLIIIVFCMSILTLFGFQTGLYGQTKMMIHKKDKTVISVTLTEIDKIVYSDPEQELKANTITDIDGNVYKTVMIGKQLWTAEDLRTTRFTDGTVIPQIEDSEKWKKNGEVPAMSWYENKKEGKYGALYNGYAVERGYLCPKGWRVPKMADWEILINECGGIGTAGSKLKESGTAYWNAPNFGSLNEKGFSALGTGYRTSSGEFTFRNGTGIWWSSSEATYSNFATLAMYYNYQSVVKGSFPKSQGNCVRCIKEDL
jgi:uncharacterized protein (TIGR02145 family)